MESARVDPEPFDWRALGVDDGGLPTHLPMPINAEGQGPVSEEEAQGYACWCGDSECLLTETLRLAWAAGRRTK